jgi:hypothetical protein
MAGLLARTAVYDKMSLPIGKGETSDFKNGSSAEFVGRF